MKIKLLLLISISLVLSGCALFSTDRQVFIDYRSIEKFWTYCNQCISSNCDDKDLCERNMSHAAIVGEFRLSVINSDIKSITFFLNEMHIDVNEILSKEYQYSALSLNAYNPKQGSDEVTKLLINRGANINHITGGAARTSVLRAIWKKNNPVARVLISHGADLSIKSDRGFDACIFAHRWSNFEIMPDLPGCCERISDIEASPELREERLRPTEFLKYCRK